MAGAYAIPLAYGFEDVESMLEAFAAEKVPLNAKSSVLHRMDREDEEVARVLTHAVALYWATGESHTIWDCLYVAWIFERG